jgi:hypothetical protein
MPIPAFCAPPTNIRLQIKALARGAAHFCLAMAGNQNKRPAEDTGRGSNRRRNLVQNANTWLRVPSVLGKPASDFAIFRHLSHLARPL